MELKKKEFKYRGMTVQELQALDVREFAKHAHSRARRTLLRNFQEIEDFISRSKKKQEKGKKIKTHKRDLVIVPQLIGLKIGVYSGREFVYVEITGEMLGHKLGEFAPSRGKIKHSSAGVGGTKGTRAAAKH